MTGPVPIVETTYEPHRHLITGVANRTKSSTGILPVAHVGASEPTKHFECGGYWGSQDFRDRLPALEKVSPQNICDGRQYKAPSNIEGDCPPPDDPLRAEYTRGYLSLRMNVLYLIKVCGFVIAATVIESFSAIQIHAESRELDVQDIAQIMTEREKFISQNYYHVKYTYDVEVPRDTIKMLEMAYYIQEVLESGGELDPTMKAFNEFHPIWLAGEHDDNYGLREIEIISKYPEYRLEQGGVAEVCDGTLFARLGSKGDLMVDKVPFRDFPSYFGALLRSPRAFYFGNRGGGYWDSPETSFGYDSLILQVFRNEDTKVEVVGDDVFLSFEVPDQDSPESRIKSGKMVFARSKRFALQSVDVFRRRKGFDVSTSSGTHVRYLNYKEIAGGFLPHSIEAWTTESLSGHFSPEFYTDVLNPRIQEVPGFRDRFELFRHKILVEQIAEIGEQRAIDSDLFTIPIAPGMKIYDFITGREFKAGGDVQRLGELLKEKTDGHQ